MQSVVAFKGAVHFRYSAACPLPGELRGSEQEPSGARLLLHFAAPGIKPLPAELQEVSLACDPAVQSCTLHVGARRIALEPGRWTLHRDLQKLSESVIAPRPVRWRMRMFWRLVFVLIRFPAGQRLLLRRYDR